MVKFKKYLLSLTLAFSILGWMCSDLQVSAAPAGHVHEWGSYEWVEYVIEPAVDVTRVLYTYEEWGHTYQVQQVVDWCKLYRECYCGQRGEYREGGRPRIETIMIK